MVHRFHPSLPKHPLPAAAWLGLLAAGALDAEVYPDRASAAIEALWAGTQHPSPLVRAEAYKSLAAYPPELLEQLEVERPLSHYVGPLVTLVTPGGSVTWEGDVPARAAAEKLACLALTHEHVNRRRFLASATVATAGSSATAGGGQQGAGEHGSEGTGAESAGGHKTGKAGGGSSAAAAAREAASVRHRLLSTLPPALSAAAAGPTATGPARMHSHPGAALLCGKSIFTAAASKAGSARGGKEKEKEKDEQQQAMHAAWAARMESGLRGMGADGTGTDMGTAVTAAAGVEHASVSLAIRSWAVFFRK